MKLQLNNSSGMLYGYRQACYNKLRIEQITIHKRRIVPTYLLSTLNTHLHPSGALLLPRGRALNFCRYLFRGSGNPDNFILFSGY
jgi:hypothetical protein